MIQVTVLYPRTDGEGFDFDYYKEHHMGMVKRFFGDDVWDIVVEKGAEGGRPGSKPKFVAVCRLQTHSTECWHKYIDKNLEEFVGDIPNFTNIQPIILFTEIVD